MKKQFLLFGTLCLLAFSACNKTITHPTSNGSASIVGNWQFVKAVGGFTGHQVVNANGKLIYSFTADSIFKETKNDTLKSTGRFYIRTEKSIFTGTMQPSLRFIDVNSGLKVLFSIKADTLVLTDNHVEPFAYTYVRVK